MHDYYQQVIQCAVAHVTKTLKCNIEMLILKLGINVLSISREKMQNLVK